MSQFAAACATLLLLWCVAGALSALFYRAARKRLLGLHPRQASALVLAWVCAPAAFALALTLLLFDLPGTTLVPAHCHGGNCRAHAPLLGTGPSTVVGSVALLLLMLQRVCAGWLHLSRGARLGRALAAVSRPGKSYRLLAQEAAAAFTTGWWRQVIFLSEGLLARCSASDIGVILAHEHAHRLRRDNLRILLARSLAAPLPGFARSPLWRDLRLLTEQACDEHASLDCGRLAVAGALLRVSRLQASDTPAWAQAFTQSGTEQRVEALLRECRAPLSRGHLLARTLALGFAPVIAIAPLHHLLELLR